MPDTAVATGKIILDVAHVTNVGGRASNQDALSTVRQNGLACFVVSDGVGGEKGGEVASQAVVETIVRSFVEQAMFDPHVLQSYVERAAIRLAELKSAEERLSAMSATVAAVLVDQSSGAALWAHMGDTRIYLFRQNLVHRVTKDHSLVQQLIDAGYCKADQLRRHPQRSTLCAALGAEGNVEVTEAALTLQTGDAFLICTDGFWEWITEQEMEQAAASAESAEEWLMTMRATVDKRGYLSASSADNYTAFAIYVSHIEQ